MFLSSLQGFYHSRMCLPSRFSHTEHLPGALMAGMLMAAALLSATTLQAAGLSTAERQMAGELAAQTSWLTTADQSVKQAAAAVVQPLGQYPPGQHPLGPQTLSIELDERKAKPALRRLRVYQFDYNRQHARMLLIDPATERVIEQHRIDSVHLPLNDNEAAFAMALLEADRSLFNQLQAERLRRGLSPLESISELDVKASIYEPLNINHRCAKERCALLSLFDNTRTVFAIEPLIFLNSGAVGTLSATADN